MDKKPLPVWMLPATGAAIGGTIGLLGGINIDDPRITASIRAKKLLRCMLLGGLTGVGVEGMRQGWKGVSEGMKSASYDTQKSLLLRNLLLKKADITDLPGLPEEDFNTLPPPPKPPASPAPPKPPAPTTSAPGTETPAAGTSAAVEPPNTVGASEGPATSTGTAGTTSTPSAAAAGAASTNAANTGASAENNINSWFSGETFGVPNHYLAGAGIGAIGGLTLYHLLNDQRRRSLSGYLSSALGGAGIGALGAGMYRWSKGMNLLNNEPDVEEEGIEEEQQAYDNYMLDNVVPDENGFVDVEATVENTGVPNQNAWEAFWHPHHDVKDLPEPEKLDYYRKLRARTNEYAAKVRQDTGVEATPEQLDAFAKRFTAGYLEDIRLNGYHHLAELTENSHAPGTQTYINGEAIEGMRDISPGMTLSSTNLQTAQNNLVTNMNTALTTMFNIADAPTEQQELLKTNLNTASQEAASLAFSAGSATAEINNALRDYRLDFKQKNGRDPTAEEVAIEKARWTKATSVKPKAIQEIYTRNGFKLSAPQLNYITNRIAALQQLSQYDASVTNDINFVLNSPYLSASERLNMVLPENLSAEQRRTASQMVNRMLECQRMINSYNAEIAEGEAGIQAARLSGKEESELHAKWWAPRTYINLLRDGAPNTHKVTKATDAKRTVTEQLLNARTSLANFLHVTHEKAEDNNLLSSLSPSMASQLNGLNNYKINLAAKASGTENGEIVTQAGIQDAKSTLVQINAQVPVLRLTAQANNMSNMIDKLSGQLDTTPAAEQPQLKQRINSLIKQFNNLINQSKKYKEGYYNAGGTDFTDGQLIFNLPIREYIP